MAKKRSSVLKRQRENQKRQREQAKAERAKLKRQRKLDRDLADEVPGDNPAPPVDPTVLASLGLAEPKKEAPTDG